MIVISHSPSKISNLKSQISNRTHPQMTERAFVLVPLAEIALDWVHPVTKSAIAQLLQTADCSGVQKLQL